MTEQEWLVCEEPARMLQFFVISRATPFMARHSRLTNRKLRLFGCACCRLEWELLGNQRTNSRRAVEVSEAFADGQATDGDLTRAGRRASDDECNVWETDHFPCGSCAAVFCAGPESCLWTDARRILTALPRHPASFAALLRDIVGNPFHPVRIVSDWLTPLVVAMAGRAYLERDWEALPILADALEDAGCAEVSLLRHLRQPSHVHGPQCRDQDGLWCSWEANLHTRGCWALDLLLGKQ